MIIRRTPNFAPDGSTGHGRDFFAAVAAAASGNGASVTESAMDGRRRRASDREQYHHNHEGYDDGLVHSHGWAASDR
jgi:S-adenosylmethionine hydrolase